MRLRRLDLTRFGRFTDFPIDFGEHDSSKPDLHVIYGPNETGKSTLLAAYLDLIFGITKRSPYDFLHGYPSMRIGARLDIADQTHELARIKRDKESLLGPDDKPVAESLLTSVLGSIDRESYTTMFSLDDDTLQSGGESILNSEGDLGQLLFSATSGFSRLSQHLDEITQMADEFHRRGGRATELKRLKDRLAELKEEQRGLDTNANQYAELVKTAADAHSALESARTERDQTKVSLDRFQRLVDALPTWAKLRELRAELEPLQELPDPPDGWDKEALELSQKEASTKTELAGAEKELARLSDGVDETEADPAILGLQERIDRLPDQEGRYRGAEEDIPTRENDLLGVKNGIQMLLSRLGRQATDDPAKLPLPAATVGDLNELIEVRSGLVVRHDTAREERDTARDLVGQAEKTVEDHGVATDITLLEAVLAKVRRQEHGARLELAQTHCSKLETEIEEDLNKLRPWQGDTDALAALEVPAPARIEGWKEDLKTGRDLQAKQTQKLQEHVEKRDRYNAEIVVVKQSTGDVDDARAAATRLARDQAWEAHRTLLNGSTPDSGTGLQSTADTFEATLAEDDRVMELRARQSAEIAQLRHAEENVAQEEASIKHVEEQLGATRANLAKLTAGIAEALRPIGLASDMEPADIQRWIDQREETLKLRLDIQQAKRDLQAAKDIESEARNELAKAMTAIGPAPDDDLQLALLLELAQKAIDQAQGHGGAIAGAKKDLQDKELDLQRRERDFEAADLAMLDWQKKWDILLAECWLGEAGVERSTAEIREVLMALSELPEQISKRDDLDRRIRSMEDDKSRLVTNVGKLLSIAGPGNDVDGVLDVAKDLRDRLGKAKGQAKLQESKMEDVERVETQLREARQAMVAIDRRRTEMGDLFEVDTFIDIIGKLGQATKKASLVRQIAGEEHALVEALKQPSLVQAEAVLKEVASNEEKVEKLQNECSVHEALLKDRDDLVTELFHESKTAKAAVAAVAGDAEVARLEEERRTVLLEIQDRAERHLRLKAGVAAAERALEIYRDRHRSSMMTQAGQAFSTITRNRFSDLTTVPGKNGEILVGMQSTGGSLIAPDMSKGTRFQLYLALRIAGYHEFAKHHETLPFVADDIMETFDDDRSSETFDLLSGMAEKGQVIYLTHHAHLCDIARKICGDGVQVHELPALPIPTPEGNAVAEG